MLGLVFCPVFCLNSWVNVAVAKAKKILKHKLLKYWWLRYWHTQTYNTIAISISGANVFALRQSFGSGFEACMPWSRPIFVKTKQTKWKLFSFLYPVGGIWCDKLTRHIPFILFLFWSIFKAHLHPGYISPGVCISSTGNNEYLVLFHMHFGPLAYVAQQFSLSGLYTLCL